MLALAGVLRVYYVLYYYEAGTASISRSCLHTPGLEILEEHSKKKKFDADKTLLSWCYTNFHSVRTLLLKTNGTNLGFFLLTSSIFKRAFEMFVFC